MVTQSLELTTSPWFRDISNLKQSFGNWRNPLCVVFAWKGRRTSFSAVATAHVSFVQSSLVFAIFARSPLRLKYNYFNCVWCHGGFFFFFFNYLSIRHESSFGEQPLLSEISLFPCSAMFRFTSRVNEIRIKAIHIVSVSKRNRVKSGHIFIFHNI